MKTSFANLHKSLKNLMNAPFTSNVVDVVSRLVVESGVRGVLSRALSPTPGVKNFEIIIVVDFLRGVSGVP